MNVDDPRVAFGLGFDCSKSDSSGGNSIDQDHVRELLREAIGKMSAAYTAQWPIDGVGPIQVALEGEPPIALRSNAARAFARGAFCALAVLTSDELGEPCIQIAEDPRLACIQLLLEIPAPDNGAWRGSTALDVVGQVLSGSPVALPSVSEAFDVWRLRVAHLASSGDEGQAMRVQLVHPEACLPHKEHVSDSGYDLTLLYEKKRFGKTILFGTGVVVEAPYGWYFDVVPRSSIIKKGYLLANSVGVIDRSYRGEIFVPLIKIDDNAPDLELPARVAQLIPRPIVHFTVEEKTSLSQTRRGAGGFGSTGQ